MAIQDPTLDHGDRIVRLEERLIALCRRLEDQIAALRQHHEDDIAHATMEMKLTVDLLEAGLHEAKAMTAALEKRYEQAHADLVARFDRAVDRVDNIGLQVSGVTGTSSGTLRIFMVASVALALIAVIVTIVHGLG